MSIYLPSLDIIITAPRMMKKTKMLKIYFKQQAGRLSVGTYHLMGIQSNDENEIDKEFVIYLHGLIPWLNE